MKKLSLLALIVAFVWICGFAYAHDLSAPQDKGPFTLNIGSTPDTSNASREMSGRSTMR